MPLRVAFDISELGADHGSPQNRRGVNRVVAEVGEALVRLAEDRSNHFELAVTGTQNSAGAASYLNARQGEPLACAPLLSKPAHRRWTAAEQRLRTFAADAADRAIVRRAARWLASRSLPALRRVARRLPSFDPEAVDVFHSTGINPFPANVLRARRPACISTLYDLIPLLRPDLVAPVSVEGLKSMLATFKPEHFGICISQHVKDDCCERLHVDPNHLFVAPLAADPSRFYPCTDAAEITAICRRCLLGDGRPYFLSLCTVEKRKNLLHLIRCFGRLQRETASARDVCLALVGYVPEHTRQRVESIVAAEKLESRVVLTGYVADQDLAPLYSGALAFVFPSLAEGFGLPPLEAMQCGVPVVCSNRTSLPEVVGDAGLLIDPENADALCNAMQQILDQPGLREELARRSLARAAQFSWQRCALDHLAAYRAAAQLKRRTSSH